MASNHAPRIEESDAQAIEARAREMFEQDVLGTAFARHTSWASLSSANPVGEAIRTAYLRAARSEVGA